MDQPVLPAAVSDNPNEDAVKVNNYFELSMNLCRGSENWKAIACLYASCVPYSPPLSPLPNVSLFPRRRNLKPYKAVRFLCAQRERVALAPYVLSVSVLLLDHRCPRQDIDPINVLTRSMSCRMQPDYLCPTKAVRLHSALGPPASRTQTGGGHEPRLSASILRPRCMNASRRHRGGGVVLPGV